MPELRKLVRRVIYTDAAGSASSIARDAKEFDGIVVVGGDGTIFEVIDGMDRQRQNLAVIPTGRGNCLARDLRIKKIAQGLRALRGGRIRCVDLLRADIGFGDGRRERYLSASTIAVGYVVSVVDRAAKFRTAGRYGYALSTLVTRPRTFSYSLRNGGPDGAERSCTGIVINNTVHLANFPAFRDAVLDDGLMDALILDGGWLHQTLHNLSILSGLNMYEPGERHQLASAELMLCSPQTLMIDGQLYSEASELAVDCIPAALLCLCPVL